MNNDQNKPGGTPETELRSAEAQLFAEILNRMDEQSKSKQMADQGAGSHPQEEQTIDLVELFFFLLSKLHYIVLGMVLGGILLGIYATSCVVPVYSATSKLYIMGQTGVSIMSDLQIGSSLTMDYQEVFKTWEVHEMVNEQLGLNYSYSQLQRMLTVTNPNDTRVLYITIKDTDPQRAANIANAYATAAKRFITDAMDTDEPSTFSLALVPSVASSTGPTSYIIRGILLGTVAAGAILVLIFFLDSRPKSPDDIMRYANIPTLAVLPVHPELSGDEEHKRKAKKK